MNQLVVKNCSIICEFFLIPMFYLCLILMNHPFYVVIGLFNEEYGIQTCLIPWLCSV